MALNTLDRQLGTEGTTSPVFDYIPHFLCAGRLTYKTPVDFFTALFPAPQPLSPCRMWRGLLRRW